MLQKVNFSKIEPSKESFQIWEDSFDEVIECLIYKMKMETLSSLVESDEIISFTTFIFHSNNFCLYFQEWFLKEILQWTPFFKSFKETNTSLYNQVQKKINNLNYEQRLYLASWKETKENIVKFYQDQELLLFFNLFYEAYLELKKLWATNGELLWFNT